MQGLTVSKRNRIWHAVGSMDRHYEYTAMKYKRACAPVALAEMIHRTKHLRQCPNLHCNRWRLCAEVRTTVERIRPFGYDRIAPSLGCVKHALESQNMASPIIDDKLRRVYELLREVFDEPSEDQPDSDDVWHTPSLPPVGSGAQLSATDLLGWWFRPPSGKKNGWDDYFPDSPALEAAPVDAHQAHSTKAASPSSASRIVANTIRQAMLPETDDHLNDEDSEAAVDVLYAFLHAFANGDIEGALQWVSGDYHVIEDDQEIDRNGLRRRLEYLLDSLDGFDIEVSLSTPPEPLPHPYGIVMYVEIQIDGHKHGQNAVRSQVEHRLALFEKQGEQGWKIAALSRPRI